MLVLALTATSCATWNRSKLEPSAALPPGGNHDVRVHLRSGRFVVLENAHVEGDSLVGTAPARLPFDPARHREKRTGPRRAVALADIDTLDVEKISVVRTALLVLLVGGLAFVVGVGIELSDGLTW
jgi:hypothetical protein